METLHELADTLGKRKNDDEYNGLCKRCKQTDEDDDDNSESQYSIESLVSDSSYMSEDSSYVTSEYSTDLSDFDEMLEYESESESDISEYKSDSDDDDSEICPYLDDSDTLDDSDVEDAIVEYCQKEEEQCRQTFRKMIQNNDILPVPLTKLISTYKKETDDDETNNLRMVLYDLYTHIDEPNVDEIESMNVEEIQNRINVCKNTLSQKYTELFVSDVIKIADIRYEQQKTDLILDRTSFKRLVKEISRDFKSDIHFDQQAIEALQTATEYYLLELFKDATERAINRNGQTVGVQDLQSSFRQAENKHIS